MEKANQQWQGMSKAEFGRLCLYVREAANLLELRDWEFIIGYMPTTAKNANAEIEVTAGRKLAGISVAEDWEKLDPKQKRHVIAHELIHCHFEELHRIICTTFPPLLGPAGWKALEPALNWAEERGVDAIATIAASVLPPYPVEDRAKPASRKRKPHAAKKNRRR